MDSSVDFRRFLHSFLSSTNTVSFITILTSAIKNVHKHTHLINSLLYLIKKLDSEVLVAAERAKHA